MAAMAWTWIRPQAPEALEARPLVDLGTGDGQTLLALTEGGLRIAVDRSRSAMAPLRGAAVTRLQAEATLLPLRTGSTATVLAGDLLHHLPDAEVAPVLAEIRRVLAPAGHLVAWWYARSPRGGPDSPRHPRSWDDVAERASGVFARLERLKLVPTVETTTPTVGIWARR